MSGRGSSRVCLGRRSGVGEARMLHGVARMERVHLYQQRVSMYLPLRTHAVSCKGRGCSSLLAMETDELGSAYMPHAGCLYGGPIVHRYCDGDRLDATGNSGGRESVSCLDWWLGVMRIYPLFLSRLSFLLACSSDW